MYIIYRDKTQISINIYQGEQLFPWYSQKILYFPNDSSSLRK